MKRICLALMCILCSHVCFSQTYETCVKQFEANNYAEAITGLEALRKTGNNDAALLLALIHADQNQYKDAFKDFVQFAAKSSNPYPYIYALTNAGIFSDHNDETREFLQTILDDPKADMTTKHSVTDLLGYYLSRQSRFDEMRSLYGNTGDVKKWSTVGTFENISGSGFNKDFGVLAHPESDYVFKNKIGVDVNWFDITTVRNDRWYDFEYHYNIDNAIIYAQTFITSTEDKDILLKIGVSGSVKVWMNDFLVGGEPLERNTNADVYSYKVKLQKGCNRLLLQLGSSEISRNNFMVRLFDLNGNIIPDVVSESHYKPYAKATPYNVEKPTFFAEKFFEEKFAADTGNFVNGLLLLHVYNENENTYAAHKVLKQLKNSAPNCTYLSEEAIRLARIDKNTIDASKERESVITHDPESTDGLMYRYDEVVNKEKWDDALELLNKYTALYGTSGNIESKRISVLIKKKDNEAAVSKINDAYLIYPETYDIALYKYYAILGGSKNLESADNILLRYLKNNYNITVIQQMIENDFKLGKKSDALKWYKKMLENNPISVGLYAKYAEALYEENNYNDAISGIDQALAIAPYIGRYYEIKGKAYESKSEKANAIAMYKKAIAYNPTDYSTRKMLTRLEGKKNLEDNFIQNNITALYMAGRDNKSYDQEDAVYLLNDKKEIVYPENGAVVQQQEILILAKSKAAIERLKEYEISYNPYSQRLIVDKAEVLKKDGNKVAAERQKGNCVFSSIEVGDAIHLSYKLESSFEGKLAEQFWESFEFNSSFPVETSRFSIIVPAEKKISFETINTTVKPVVKDLDNYKMYTWEEDSVAKVVPEMAMSSDEMQDLIVSSIPDWNYVANWYSDVSNEKTIADFEVKEQVRELMKGNESKSDLEKARIIYNYIEANYHYSNVSFLHSAFTPQSASRTLNSKLGDCKDLSTLFVSMAREAGLNANLVLVSTRDNGNNDVKLPNIAFNHCIARLHTNGKDYIIELTNKYLPFGAMAYSILNANGLDIPKDGKTGNDAAIIKLNTADRPQNKSERRSAIAFESDKCVVHRRTMKIGAESAEMRYYYESINENERKKKLNEDLNKEFNKNVVLKDIKFTNLENQEDTVVLDYDFTIDNFITTIAGMKVFKLPWTASYPLAQIFALEKRIYPIQMWYLSATPGNRETLTVALPEGKKLLEQPQDVSYSCPAFSYSIRYKINGNKLTATRDFTYLKEEINPEEYAVVKATASKILESDSKQMAFK